MTLSNSQVCRYPNSRSGATQTTKTATPMAILASGALGRNERYGQERTPISELTMRKRTGYNHWGGSGIMRSSAMIPTKARNGAMYAAVARRRESADGSMCDRRWRLRAVCYGNPQSGQVWQ